MPIWLRRHTRIPRIRRPLEDFTAFIFAIALLTDFVIKIVRALGSTAASPPFFGGGRRDGQPVADQAVEITGFLPTCSARAGSRLGAHRWRKLHPCRLFATSAK